MAYANTLGFERFPLHSLPEMQAFDTILELYFSKTKNSKLPTWKDFDFSEFVGWHARVALSKREGDDFRFRIFGSAFVEVFAADLTGKSLTEMMAPQHLVYAQQHFKKLIEGPFVGLGKGQVPVAHREFVKFQVLHLPLSDVSVNLDYIIHVLGPNIVAA